VSGVRTFRFIWRDRSGAEIAETAIILPLLFMIVLAIFWFGQAFRIYGTITQAARQGARAAVAPACTTCTPLTPDTVAQNAVTAVDNALTAASLSQSQVFAPGQVPNLCPCGSATSNSCTPVACYSGQNLNNVCVQPNVQLSYTSLSSENGGGAVNGAGTCGTSVSFSYKNSFNFTIPFTDLNLGNVSLPAQAQMRLETQ
jgi:Flp pilus assembly protein TadG